MDKPAELDPLDVAVGTRIRQRRRWLGLSQTDLAIALGITFQQVQKYEKGSNRISASMLVKAAARLETTVSALIGEDGAAPVAPIVSTQLATPGALELLAAFAAVPEGEKRRALLVAAEGLAAVSKTGRRAGRGSRASRV